MHVGIGTVGVHHGRGGNRNQAGGASPASYYLRLANAADAEIYRFNHGVLVVGIGEGGQSVSGDGSEMPGAVHRILDRLVVADQFNGLLDIALLHLALFQARAPECTIFSTSTPASARSGNRGKALRPQGSWNA